MAWKKLNSGGNARPLPQICFTIGFVRCSWSQLFRSIEEKLFVYHLLIEIFLLDFTQNIKSIMYYKIGEFVNEYDKGPNGKGSIFKFDSVDLREQRARCQCPQVMMTLGPWLVRFLHRPDALTLNLLY